MNRPRFSNRPAALLIALAALILAAIPAWACGGTVICVDADAAGPAHDGLSWTTAYTTVQVALDWTNANGGTPYEIWVAEGVYYPDEGGDHVNDAEVESFLIVWNNVQLYGGFAATETLRAQRDWRVHPTILSGDIDGNDWNTDTNHIAETWNDLQGSNANHVLYLDGVVNEPMTGATVLDGFIITAGNAVSSYNSVGGGLYCSGHDSGHACNPTLTNVIFSGNLAGYGGGMFNGGADGGESSPSLTNVIFSANSADHCGGGMYNYGISGNSSPDLTNVIFSGNSANYGGGTCNYGAEGVSSPVFINVTFGGNSAVGRGGGMYNEGSRGVSVPVLSNSILWGNTAPDDSQISNRSATPTIMYSDVQWPSGVYTGAGNLNVDPQFVAPITTTVAPTTTGNYRLQASSPVINGGNSLSVTVATDLDGNPRIVGAAVDMGAYEAPVSNTAPTLAIPDVSMDINTTRTLDLWEYAGDAEDADSDLTFGVGTVSGNLAADLGSDGHTLTITPTTGWTGTATVTVSVADTGGLSASDMFNVNVGLMNHGIYLPLVIRAWPPLPGTLTLQTIANDDGNGDYTVEWSVADLAVAYELQEANDAAFSSPAMVYSDTGTSWNVSGKSLGSYYYRVRGQNAYGPGPWSNAQSVQVTPPNVLLAIEDTYIAQGYPNRNYGEDSVMRAGYDTFFTPNEQIVRSLIKFDLSAIPAGTSIVTAALQVHYLGSPDTFDEMQTVTAYRITSVWSGNEVTWNSNVGIGADYGSVSLKASQSAYAKYYSIDVTELVRSWIDEPSSNYGVMLRGPENSGAGASWRSFDTSENGTNRAPFLYIAYGGTTAQVNLPSVNPEALAVTKPKRLIGPNPQ